MERSKPNYAGLVAVAGGPPGANMLALRQALEILLDGACYYTTDIENGTKIDKLHWRKAFQNRLTDKEWINFLEGRGFRSCAGYPILLFYR